MLPNITALARLARDYMQKSNFNMSRRTAVKLAFAHYGIWL